MNPETIFTHFTEAPGFSSERRVTKDALQSITRKAKWGTHDFEQLQNIKVVAPNNADLSTVFSNEGPVCFLAPGIENIEREAAEYAIVGGLARAVAMQGTGKNQIEGETRRLLTAWNYAAAAGRREAGVSA